MYNNFYLSLHGHISTPQNHSISWRLFYSDSNIAEVESRAGKPVSSRRSNVADCNGKEKDWESGFHYYGARYYWSELLTGWLSVDPMMDKYPSMSPYAYCTWNPVKLVDPDGKEIDVSELSATMQNRIVKCLSTITGLNLKVKDGMLVSTGENSNADLYSNSARKDLLNAIGDKKKINVFNSEDYNLDGDYGDYTTGEIWIGSVFHAGNEDYDDKTEGLGMAFLHELGHAYFGDNDPTINEHKNSFIWEMFHGDMPYPNSDLDLGGAVNRVNRYRKELGMATRASYESYNYRDGDRKRWQQYEGMVAFEINGKMSYLKLR